MSSSFQTYGKVQSEKGLSELSSSSKGILEKFYSWVGTKYGISNVNYLNVYAENNGLYNDNGELDDFNLLFDLNLNSHEITTFKQDSIDIDNDTISIQTLDLNSNSTLQVGDVVNIKFSSGSNGALPSGLNSYTKIFVKTITPDSSNYKLTFSSAYDGDNFDFTDNGIKNFDTDSFAIGYGNTRYALNFKYDKSTGIWDLSNYSGSNDSNFSIDYLNSNPNLSIPETYGNLNSKDGNSVTYITDYGHDISLTGTSSINTDNTLNQNLLSLGIDLSESRWDTFIYNQINSTQNGLVSVIKDPLKYKVIINADGSNPEIIQEIERPTDGSSKRVLELLEANDGSIYYVLEHQYTSHNDAAYENLESSIVRIKTDKTIETTSLTSFEFLKDGSNVGAIGNYEYKLIPETDGDIWLLKEERVNGEDGSAEEAFKYTGWRFNHSNFDLNDPDIIIDSILDMNNHYSSGQFLVETSGEDYNFNFSYTNDANTHNLFVERGDAIDEAVNYAVSISENLNLDENTSIVKTFDSNSIVTWSINGGNDSDKFVINSTTGTLSFKEAPDYENPTDSDSNNSYHVLIRATDLQNTTRDERVLLKVNDKEETSPSSNSDSSSSDSSSSSSSTQIKVADINSSYVADSKGFASINGSTPVSVTSYEIGKETTLNSIKDYDGNLHAGDNLTATASSYKYQGMLDVNGDGVFETIFTNKSSKRWVTAKVDSNTGQIDFDDNGAGGGTRVVGIYADPLIAEGENNGGYLSDGVTPAPANFGVSDADRYVVVSGETIDRLALNSQVRFQNDLEIDNLQAKHSGDYDSDGIHEVYWKTADGTAYLRSLMHADGNIRYANYQSLNQMVDYLTNNGDSSAISDIL